MKVSLFLQARLDSSRLPQKALRPLAGLPSLELSMADLLGCADTHVLACPAECLDIFAPLAQKRGFALFGGDKENVLNRFAGALQAFPADWVIRATADNSIVGVELAQSLLKRAIEENADYAIYKGPPRGSNVEIIKASALKTAAQEAQSPYDKEHVCPYLYAAAAKGRFKVLYEPAPQRWHAPDLRSTLDTPEDYARLQQAYKDLYKGKPILPEEFIRWAKSH